MKNPRQKEWDSIIKKEKSYLNKSSEKKSSILNQMLNDKVPPKLQSTLNAAFSKAFEIVFEKGTEIIEKTYNREDSQRTFKINSYSIELKENRKSLKQFSKQASSSSQKNLLLSGIEGIGLGILGIGIPDIPLFVGVILKSIYEISLHYGYNYDSPKEKYFILMLIQTALSFGDELLIKNNTINAFIENHQLSPNYSQKSQIENTASMLSTELLYMKFLQGIPLIGTIGGIYDAIYLQKIQKYAKIKYARRFILDLNNKDAL